MSLLAGGMLWVGLWLLRREKLPAWLVKLVIAGALLRLAFGAVWFVALPVWGHGTEAEKAILALKVCDPAVGSGHFLVGAAHRLARHLARVRALAPGESEPSPLLYQHALR